MTAEMARFEVITVGGVSSGRRGYAEWHLREAWADLLFSDEHIPVSDRSCHEGPTL